MTKKRQRLWQVSPIMSLKKAQCKALASHQEEHLHTCSSEELPEATEGHLESWC